MRASQRYAGRLKKIPQQSTFDAVRLVVELHQKAEDIGIIVSLLSQMAAAVRFRRQSAGHFRLSGPTRNWTQSQVVDGDGSPGKRLLFHVNGTVVECLGSRASQEWKDMMQYAGQDVTLLYAQNYPNLAYPVPSCYAEIQDVHRKEIEADFVSLVSRMYDTGHVLFEVVGSLKESWCSENDGK